MQPLNKVASLAPTKQAFSLLDEFKTFALKGSVIDLAVGVIIGAAFGAIVKSLVDNVMMPLIGTVIPGNQNYKDLAWHVGGQEIKYGAFLADVVNFVVVAFALFLFIQKFLGWIMKAKKEEVAAPAPPSKEQLLLTEIRDLLKANNPAPH